MESKDEDEEDGDDDDVPSTRPSSAPRKDDYPPESRPSLSVCVVPCRQEDCLRRQHPTPLCRGFPTSEAKVHEAPFKGRLAWVRIHPPFPLAHLTDVRIQVTYYPHTAQIERCRLIRRHEGSLTSKTSRRIHQDQFELEGQCRQSTVKRLESTTRCVYAPFLMGILSDSILRPI